VGRGSRKRLAPVSSEVSPKARLWAEGIELVDQVSDGGQAGAEDGPEVVCRSRRILGDEEFLDEQFRVPFVAAHWTHVARFAGSVGMVVSVALLMAKPATGFPVGRCRRRCGRFQPGSRCRDDEGGDVGFAPVPMRRKEVELEVFAECKPPVGVRRGESCPLNCWRRFRRGGVGTIIARPNHA